MLGLLAIVGSAAGCASATRPQVAVRSDPWNSTRSPFGINAGDGPFTVDTLLGARELADGNAWDPLENQFDVGVAMMVDLFGERSIDSGSPLEALSWDFGFRFAFDDDERRAGASDVIRETARIYDLSAGMLLSPLTHRSAFEPYVGVGAALVWVDLELDDGFNEERVRDTTVTGYVRGGARFRLGAGRHFGFDVRWLAGGDSVIDGIGADVESLTMSLLFGARF